MAVCNSLSVFSLSNKHPTQFSFNSSSKPSNFNLFTVSSEKPLKGLAVSMRIEANLFGFPSKIGGGGGGGGGGTLLERPTFDQSQFDPTPQPQPQQGGDMGWQKYKKAVGHGDRYRVLLIDDERHTEKLVARVVPKVVPALTPDDARNLFHESQLNGVAVVIVAVKEHAEFYAEMMTNSGLSAAIEPDSDTV